MMLELRGVTKRFGGLVAVNNVTLEMKTGESVGLLGANGAGKTTLFSLIAGNQRPDYGHISFEGKRIEGLRPDKISRCGIARTFQIVRPFPAMSVLENVMVGALFGSRRTGSLAKAETVAGQILEEVGLAGLANDPASSLTLAGRKRLEIARALAARPVLLMLDEVMAGLTPTEIDEALTIIRRVRARHNLAMIVIEHVKGVVMSLCPRIVVLHHGAVIAEGTPGEIADDPRVIDAYLGVRR